MIKSHTSVVLNLIAHSFYFKQLKKKSDQISRLHQTPHCDCVNVTYSNKDNLQKHKIISKRSTCSLSHYNCKLLQTDEAFFYLFIFFN